MYHGLAVNQIGGILPLTGTLGGGSIALSVDLSTRWRRKITCRSALVRYRPHHFWIMPLPPLQGCR